jgi:hypothetical protein
LYATGPKLTVRRIRTDATPFFGVTKEMPPGGKAVDVTGIVDVYPAGGVAATACNSDLGPLGQGLTLKAKCHPE